MGGLQVVEQCGDIVESRCAANSGAAASVRVEHERGRGLQDVQSVREVRAVAEIDLHVDDAVATSGEVAECAGGRAARRAVLGRELQQRRAATDRTVFGGDGGEVELGWSPFPEPDLSGVRAPREPEEGGDRDRSQGCESRPQVHAGRLRRSGDRVGSVSNDDTSPGHQPFALAYGRWRLSHLFAIRGIV
jgi:hypothetical protein